MEEWWRKTKKELRVVWNTALHDVGIKHEENDEQLKLRDVTIRRILSGINDIQTDLRAYVRHTFDAIAVEEKLDAMLKDPDQEPVSRRAICQKWLGEEMERRCIAPLTTLSGKAEALLAIRDKRRRKLGLMQTSSGAEQEKWQRSFTKYHNAYMTGVDKIGDIYDSVVSQVVEEQKWIMQQLAKELSQFEYSRPQGSLQSPVEASAIDGSQEV